MQLTETRWNNFILRTWVCHTNRWELLMSWRYPERYSWEPHCTDCERQLLQNLIHKGIQMNVEKDLPKAIEAVPDFLRRKDIVQTPEDKGEGDKEVKVKV